MRRVLTLNSDFSPMDIIDWKRAFVLIYKDSDEGGASLVCSYAETIKDSAGRQHPLPAVIVLNKYVSMPQLATYSANNVCYRDGLTCQYCGTKHTRRELTIDHVIPTSKFKAIAKARGLTYSRNSFLNCVCCCKSCNRKKGDKTLKEAGMALMRLPKVVTRKDAFLNKIFGFVVPKEWSLYLEHYINI